MKLRWKILIAVGVFLVLMAVSLSFTLHVQPANELDAYKKFLRDHGEKLDLGEVPPPPVAPDDNSVVAVEDAFGMFGSGDEKIPFAMTMVAPGKAMVGWSQPDARGYDFTNSWGEFGTDVAANGPAVELLHQVLDRPKLDFQLDYKMGPALALPLLMSMKRSAQILEATTVLDLHDGDTGAAATNILTLLALVQKETRDELLISHLVRMAITTIAITPTWELLQATNATDVQLAAVQNGWEQMNFLSDAENAFTMERAWSSAEIQKFRSLHDSFAGMYGPTSSGSSSIVSGDWKEVLEEYTERPRNAVGELMWRSSWSYSEELKMIRTHQIILEGVRMMQTNRSRFYKADYDAIVPRLSSLEVTNAGEAFFRALKIPDFGEDFGDFGINSILLKTLRVEAARDVVVTAIALKRFQLKHGQWPETLDKLVPEFLPSVPIDIDDGKPLKYRPNADGTYLLYSVGEDGVDDGGDPTTTGGTSFGWQNSKARDWVWPQPATPAEVRNFYDHPPK
jgi:hypothetical protein